MKFSIIIPVYNVAPYLHECLDSVLSQTYADWEVICVDDGSTDGSGAILDDYSEKDSRFKIIHQKNGGVSSARNAGLTAADGDWVLFVDGDDVWHRDTLAVCLRLIEAHPKAQIVRFARLRFADGDKITWKKDADLEQVTIRDIGIGLSEDDMRYSFVCNCCHRSIIPRYGFKNYAYGEDLLFRAECLANATHLVETSRCLYAYRMREGSATHLPISKLALMDRIGYSIEWLHVLSKKPAPAAIWRRIAQELTEAYVQGLLSVGKSDRSELWCCWYDMLPKLLHFKEVRGWYRFVASVCLLVRSHALAVLLCAAPAKAKRIIRSHLHIGG